MLIKVVKLDDEERSQKRCVVCDRAADYIEVTRAHAEGSLYYHDMCRRHVTKNASIPPEHRERILPVELR